MKPLIFLSEIIFAGLALIYLFFQKILIHIICIYRDSKSPFKNDPDFLEINNVALTKNYVKIDGYMHLVSQCGNKNAEEKKHYKKLKLLPNSKMHTFALIPKSAHFNVIENPKGCAHAVYDFIKS